MIDAFAVRASREAELEVSGSVLRALNLVAVRDVATIEFDAVAILREAAFRNEFAVLALVPVFAWNDGIFARDLVGVKIKRFRTFGCIKLELCSRPCPSIELLLNVIK